MTHFLLIGLLSIQICSATNDSTTMLSFNSTVPIVVPNTSLLAWPKDADPSKHLAFGGNGQTITVDRTLAAKYFASMEDPEENKEVIPLELFSENGAQAPTEFKNLIQWIETYEARTPEPSNSQPPPITLETVLIADNLGLMGACVQPFYEQAAKTLTFEEVFKIMNTSLSATLNYIKSNPLAFYNHLNEAKTKLNLEGYQAYLAKLKEDTRDAILNPAPPSQPNPIPLSQLMKLNPDIMMHHVSVTEAQARAWQVDQADVNAFFTKFPNTPLVIDFGDAERIEDYFGWSSRLYTSTLPPAIKHMIIKGSNLRTVGNDFLFDCSGLTQLVLPQNITIVGNYFLLGCSNLIQLKLPQGLTTVGRGFFSSCSGLKHLVLPHSLTTVGYHFLSYCENLKTVLAHKIMPAWDAVKAQIGDKLVEIPE